MSKVFKYYYDLMSQPSRALWIAFKHGNTPFEDVPVALRKREQLSDEYKRINRFQQVPCIVDGDFHLSESVAILRYLADKGQVNEKLYPKEIQQRARVDEFLEWQHMTVRRGCATYFMLAWLMPMNGMAHMPSEEKVDKLVKDMEQQLRVLEKIWLKNSNFVTGDQLTVADLFGACEVEQTRLMHYNVGKKFPKIADWLANIREETYPFYDEAHKFIYRKAEFKKKRASD